MEVPNTIIIESNKKTATQMEYENYKDAEINSDSMPIDRSSSWKSYIENGLELNEGDQISIESSQINITGDPNSTMEFTRGFASQGSDPLVDNRCAINIGYYITNKHQNNFPLPLYTHIINRNISQSDYGSPSMSNWEQLTNCVPLMAVEGARYNPEFLPKGTATPPIPPNDIPRDIASWYLGVGSNSPNDWYDTSTRFLPWLMWIGAAPLQNAPYEIYKPNETRLYKHKYQKVGELEDEFTGSYYKQDYFNLRITQVDSPYFDLTENIIDIEINEGFATPSSVGEYITSSLIELDIEKRKKYDKTTIKDAPDPSIFKLEGVFNTAQNVPNYQLGGVSFPRPQILEKEKINDNINKTFTTARTPAGTLLEDYLNGDFSGTIQYPFDIDSTIDQNNRLFFSDLLDGDVRKTATSIKFQSLKQVATSTVDILTDSKFEYDNDAVVDAGNKQPGKNNIQYPMFGKQVVIFENLPRETLQHHETDVMPKPKFWINISGEREAKLTNTSPPLDLTNAPAYIKTKYNADWKTCPPVVAQGMTCLKMKPYDLIPTNIVATRGSIAMLKRIFNTGQYIQDNEDVDKYIRDHLNIPSTQDNLLRGKAVNNNNILDKLVCNFQVGATDDANTTTEAYYSTNQINLVPPVIPFYYYNPKFNNPAAPGYVASTKQGKHMLNGGLINQSYMVLGKYNYTSPQLPNAPNAMPKYAQNNDGADIGTWSDLNHKFPETDADLFDTIANTPRLIGRCWWNKDVLDETRITPNIRVGHGAILPQEDSSNTNQGLDVDAMKKGKEAKYETEVKTIWDDRLDPQSPNFKCRLLGHDGFEGTSHFQFKCSTTNKYFDVSKLKGNVLQSTYNEMTDDNLLSIDKNGLGIVVAYLKPEVIDDASDLYLGREFITSGTHGGNNVLDIPYICVVNMSYLTAGMDETENKDLINRNKVQIPTPCIGEIFGSSLSCQDNTWSKIVNTQKTPPNMRCDAIPTLAPGEGELVAPYGGSDKSISQLNRFRTNELIPPENKYTYPSFCSIPTDVSFKAGGYNYSGFYRMSDYVPYVKIGSDNPLISFDDNYSRFSISNFHTPFYNGNNVNPFWVKVDADGRELSTAAQTNYPPANEGFAEKVKTVNRFCAAISTYKAVKNLTRVRCYNNAINLTNGWKYTEKAPCIPFSLVQSSQDVLPLQNSLSGIGLLEMIVPYRNIRNRDFLNAPTKNKQNINNLYAIIESNTGLVNTNNTDLNIGGWKKLTPFKPIEFKETLFGKMGYSIEQLLPIFGKQNNIFNRNNYNLYEGYEKNIILKQRNMVLPFTTNAFISGSTSIDFTTNFQNMPMKNLGIPRNGVSISATAETDSLIATSLPQKLAYSYLVVYSDILQQQSTYYGSNYLSTLPAIGYITRNYDTSDFFFAFSNDWSFYVDKKRMLNEFTIDIRLPNGMKPPIDDNSSILFKVIKKKLIGIVKDKDKDKDKK